MPGENLQKFNKEELDEMRMIVRRVYFKDQGYTDEQLREYVDDRECDKLIDSLLPSTVEKLREQGLAQGYIARKKFFMPTKIVDPTGKPFQREID